MCFGNLFALFVYKALILTAFASMSLHLKCLKITSRTYFLHRRFTSDSDFTCDEIHGKTIEDDRLCANYTFWNQFNCDFTSMLFFTQRRKKCVPISKVISNFVTQDRNHVLVCETIAEVIFYQQQGSKSCCR